MKRKQSELEDKGQSDLDEKQSELDEKQRAHEREMHAVKAEKST